MIRKVVYKYFDNKGSEKRVKECLERCLPILPFWAATVVVESYSCHNPKDSTTAALVTVRPQYRHICISIYLPFLDMPEVEQNEAMVHEIVHGLLAPHANWMRDKVIPIIKKTNEPLADLLESETDEKVEATTQDLAYAINEMIKTKEDS